MKKMNYEEKSAERKKCKKTARAALDGLNEEDRHSRLLLETSSESMRNHYWRTITRFMGHNKKHLQGVMNFEMWRHLAGARWAHSQS